MVDPDRIERASSKQLINIAYKLEANESGFDYADKIEEPARAARLKIQLAQELCYLIDLARVELNHLGGRAGCEQLIGSDDIPVVVDRQAEQGGLVKIGPWDIPANPNIGRDSKLM